MANPFSVDVPSFDKAWASGEEGYSAISKLMNAREVRQAREQSAQELMSGGDPKSALARLLQIGDDKGAATLASVIHNQQTADYQNKSLDITDKFHTGTLAQQATTAAESARHNRATEGQAAAALDKPVSVAAGSSLVNPKTKEVIYSGGNALSEAGHEIAARQIINGDLSALQNVGRGAQGDQKITAIRNKAAQILVEENGMTPAEAAAHLGSKVQAFKASSIGQSAEARTGATREANLNIILKATEAAIPAALEASDNVERYAGKFVPLNQIIQKGQVMTSDANLRKFGMANLQLAEHWARAMNPTGVMRESDRDMALNFLSTADSKATYRQVVEQLKTQITRERDAIKAGTSHGATVPSAAVQPAAPQAPAQAPVDWRTYFSGGK